MRCGAAGPARDTTQHTSVFPAGACCAFLLLLGACTDPQPAPLAANHFAFGVFGDGPYTWTDARKYAHLVEDVSHADIEWLLHVGDMLWFPCSDEAYQDRLAVLNSIPHPVVYTPGDNEWLDCHEDRPGNYQPLDRLESIRRIFFAQPAQSIGGIRMPIETQSADPGFAEIVENARWQRGGYVFATMHMVGGGNGLDDYPGRSAEDDAEVEKRTAAALAWMEAAFEVAGADSAHGVVLALHANPGLERDPAAWTGYVEFVAALERLTTGFSGQVLLIHGDTHTWRVDQPLTGLTGDALPNFTRLETYGSPDIGWVRVVIDSVTGRFVAFEPKRFSVFR
jgi:hypothetical protein